MGGNFDTVPKLDILGCRLLLQVQLELPGSNWIYKIQQLFKICEIHILFRMVILACFVITAISSDAILVYSCPS